MNNNNITKVYVTRENRTLTSKNDSQKTYDMEKIYNIYNPSLQKGKGVLFNFQPSVMIYIETTEDNKDKTQGLIDDTKLFLDEVKSNYSAISTALTTLGIPTTLSTLAIEKLEETINNFYNQD